MPAWIVMWVVIFKAKRTDCRYLSDVFAGLRPVEMPGFAWKNDDASRRIGLHLVAIEGLPEPDVKNARHDRVDAIFWMLVRHQFRAVGHLDPDHVRTGFRGTTARRAPGGNAGNGFQSISSGRITLKSA